MTETSPDTADSVDLDAAPDRVRAALAAAGHTTQAVTLPDSAATAALAAAALGVEVGAIANSLVFDADGQALLVMTSGAHRVETGALAARLGRDRIRRASAELVTSATHQPIGGVSPVGHPAPVETVIDEDLAQYDTLWAAAGSAHDVFPLTFDDLVRLTGGTVLPVV